MWKILIFPHETLMVSKFVHALVHQISGFEVAGSAKMFLRKFY